MKLEKIEIGGLKGRMLSARIRGVSAEFQQCFSVFGSKTYDVLDPDDLSFLHDYEQFQKKIFEMDLKLAAVLCQAFEDCNNLESIFKVITQDINYFINDSTRSHFVRVFVFVGK